MGRKIKTTVIAAIIALAVFVPMIYKGFNRTKPKSEIKPEMEFEITAEAENTKYGFAAVDYALGGKTFYRLYKSYDGGRNWLLANEDPFGNFINPPNQIYFLDSETGFVTVPLGGEEAYIFRTGDGGGSFEKIYIPKEEFETAAGFSYAPFVQPLEIMGEDDSLVLTVGQGENGDFNGGDCLGRFVSADLGKSWSFDGLMDGFSSKEPG